MHAARSAFAWDQPTARSHLQDSSTRFTSIREVLRCPVFETPQVELQELLEKMYLADAPGYDDDSRDQPPASLSESEDDRATVSPGGASATRRRTASSNGATQSAAASARRLASTQPGAAPVAPPATTRGSTAGKSASPAALPHGPALPGMPAADEGEQLAVASAGSARSRAAGSRVSARRKQAARWGKQQLPKSSPVAASSTGRGAAPATLAASPRDVMRLFMKVLGCQLVTRLHICIQTFVAPEW